MTATADPLHACRLRVTGVVQGVGFRPYVHRLALRHGLAGWVRNEAGDVQIHIEGEHRSVAAFICDLAGQAPPLAAVRRVERIECAAAGISGFAIVSSTDDPRRRQPVAPDVGICDACRAELFDPSNRRYRYPFITCTDCGPRYTVIEALPYDRERTSLRHFPLCAACRAEYEAPGDRRHHAESTACPACGPTVWLQLPASKGRVGGAASLDRAADLLRSGRIVAVRGIGGFHLAVRASDQWAVQRLRRRKRRDAKPLAVMCGSMGQALQLAHLRRPERVLLQSPARPIVVARRRRGARLARAVAPGLGTVGVMLAYSPLHLLLLEAVGEPLVMTSGNLSDEPLAVGNAEALERLGDVADAFLLHDREIVAPVDDSVVRASPAGPVLLRRARGWSPLPLELPVASPRPFIAVGGHLKNTFTLVQGAGAYVSPHIGDLEDLVGAAAFARHLERYRALYRIEPAAAVSDLHPGYLSTRLAEELGFGPPMAVQHHHAHIAAVLAEHGEKGPAIGLAFDGTGYGTDGRVWGAEFLLADLTGFTRLGQLRYAPLPGGDLAAREPWRVALGYASLEDSLEIRVAMRGIDDEAARIAELQIARGLNAPLASSMGRLFDAAAAVLGVRVRVPYEGAAALRLEALAGRRRGKLLPLPAAVEGDRWILDPVPLLASLAAAIRRNENRRDLAADFHTSVAAGSAALARRLASDAGVGTVVLGGGVFQNVRLLGELAERLSPDHRVLVARRLSPNDGAISYGQAAVAAARFAADSTR